MKVWTRIAAVAVFSVAIAWTLSLLPGLQGQFASPVFQWEKQGRLTEANMVDALAGLPLELSIVKANFRESVLSVDLVLPKGVSGERFVYHDLYELSRFSWSRTDNVELVLIRIMQEGSKPRNRELLLAMEARRTQADSIDALPATATSAQLRSFLESRYHFSYTSQWLEET